MKIIRKGPEPKRLTCQQCNSLLEYEDTDISIIKNDDESFGIVKCPVCDSANKINMPINKQKFAREGDFEYHLKNSGHLQ